MFHGPTVRQLGCRFAAVWLVALGAVTLAQARTVPEASGAGSPVPCSPYTLSPCDSVPVAPAIGFGLGFDAPAGGLSGTGFTMVLPHSVSRYPSTPCRCCPATNPG